MITFYEYLIIIAIFAFLVGFFIAIPIGAVQVEVAKRAINNQLKSAYMVALGSVISDTIYGVIACFSITSFLDNKSVKATLLLISGLLLVFLAYVSLKDALKAHTLEINTHRAHHLSIITGFSISFTNPLMIVFWIVYVQFAYDIGVIPYYNAVYLFTFVFFSGLGLFSYLFLIAKILSNVRKSISQTFIRKVNFVLSLVLSGFAAYFIVRAVELFKFTPFS